MSAVTSSVAASSRSAPIDDPVKAMQIDIFTHLKKTTKDKPLYRDLPEESLRVLKEYAPKVTFLNLGSLLFPPIAVEHSQLLFPNLATLSEIFPNLKVINLTKDIFYNNPKFDNLDRSAMQASFPNGRAIYVEYAETCVRDQLSTSERAVALQAIADARIPRQRVALPFTRPPAPAPKAAAAPLPVASVLVASVSAVSAPVVSVSTASVPAASAPAPAAAAAVAIVAQPIIEKAASNVAPASSLGGGGSGKGDAVSKKKKKRKVIVRDTRFPVDMQKQHMILAAFAYLLPTQSSLHLKQECVVLLKQQVKVLTVSKAFNRFRYLFLKAMLAVETTPSIDISKRSYISEIKPKGAMEKAFLQELATRQHPSLIQVLDLRTLTVDSQNPYGWAEKICEKYPNITQLHLPFGVSLDERLGQLLSSGLASLRVLDVSFANKADFRGILALKQLKGLYNNAPYEYVTSKWETSLERAAVEERLKSIAPPKEEVLVRQNELYFTREHIEMVSELSGLEVLYPGSLRLINDAAIEPLSKLTHLRELCLYNASITSNAIPKLKSLTLLRKLDISYSNRLDDRAFTQIAEQFPDLENFVFGANACTDVAFDTLRSMRKLTALYIDGSQKVAGSGLQTLFLNKGLQTLVIRENQPVNDLMIQFLHTVRGLKSLIIRSGTAISQQGEADFRRQRPECVLQIERPVAAAVVAEPVIAEPVVIDKPTAALEQGMRALSISDAPNPNPANSTLPDAQVGTLDLRKVQLASNAADPYAWATEICERHPNTVLLHLPLGVRLDNQLGQILRRLQSLRVLDISFCDKSDLTGLQYLTSLEELHNEIPFGEAKAHWLPPHVQMVENERRNQALPVAWANDVGYLSRENIQSISKLTNLRVLFLGPAQGVNDDVIKALGALTRLEELYMLLDAITSQGIAYLKTLTKLHTLSVRACKLLDDKALLLIRMQFPELRVLSIGGNSFTDKAFKILAGCAKLDSLQYGRCPKITSSAFRELRECAHLRRLVILDTQPVTDAIFADFQAINSLKHVKICEGKGVSGQAISTFMARRPDCEVYMSSPAVSTAFLPRALHEVRTVDLRNKSDIELPALLERNAAATFVQLPVCTISRDLGERLQALKTLVALDIAFVYKNEGLSLLQSLPKLKQLYSRFPYEILNVFFQTQEEFDAEEKDLEENKLSKGWDHFHNALTDENVEVLSKIAQLEVLDLGLSDQITDRSLPSIGRMKKLRELYFLSAPITKKGIPSLSPLRETLEVLSVLNCPKMADVEFRLLVKQFPNLTKLYCGGATKSISTATMSELKKLKKLETLVITDSLSEKGYEQLLEMTSLRSLYILKSEALTDKTILALSRLTSLRTLHITNCTVSESRQKGEELVIPQPYITELQRRLPHCKIITTGLKDGMQMQISLLFVPDSAEAGGGGGGGGAAAAAVATERKAPYPKKD